MTIIETLTENEMLSLSNAQESITIELLESLNYGDEIELNDMYTLYHYENDECVVILLTEQWEEVLTVLFSDDEIMFEAL